MSDSVLPSNAIGNNGNDIFLQEQEDSNSVSNNDDEDVNVVSNGVEDVVQYVQQRNRWLAIQNFYKYNGKTYVSYPFLSVH